MNIKPNHKKIIISLSLLMLGAILFLSERFALAQTNQLEWEPPENLSQSGSATNPDMVVSPDGVLHVIWKDTFLDYFYTSLGSEGWTEPQITSFPFDDEGESAPLLLAADNGVIHAFWTDEENTLFTSQVGSANFGNGFRWTSSIRLASLVSAFDVDIDEDGAIRLAFIRFEDLGESPAGVYFRRSLNGGFSWSAEQTLYTSPYLRSETPEGGNIDIATDHTTSDNSITHVVWDNPLRERVYLATSSDGGQTWQEEIEVDAPDTESTTTDPFNIKLNAQNGNVVMIWQVGDPEGNCQSRFQASSDGGTSWSSTQVLPGNELGCQRGIQFTPIGDNLSVYLTKDFKDYYLRAWDGLEWGPAQPQTSLTSFTDPDTFNKLALECPKLTVNGEDDLYFIGCATDLSGDIWISTRKIGEKLDWYPVTESSAWSPVEPIEFATDPVGGLRMVIDQTDRVHLVWDTPVDLNDSSTPSSLYYARFENGIWSSPNEIISSPSGSSNHPAVAVDQGNRLHLVWSGGDEGNIYYSWANTSDAVSSSEWSDPIQLPAPDIGAGSPDIFIDPSGIIYVTYAITVNESRGVYVTVSRDMGTTWEPAIQVFDAAGAGWEMVDKPDITGGPDGSLDLIWTKFTLPSGVRPAGLYYSRSEDHGRTWDDATFLYDGQVDWSKLLGSNSEINQIWQSTLAGIPNLFHRFTRDGGLTWIEPDQIPGLADGGVSDVASDSSGQMHLVNVSKDIVGDYRIQHWHWDGSTWLLEEGLNLGSGMIASTDSLAISVSDSGQLFAVISGELFNNEGTDPTQQLIYSQREVDILESPLVTAQIPTSTPGVAEATPTPQPSPTPTVSFENEQVNPAQIGFLGISSSIAAPVIGLIGALLVTGIAVAAVVLLKRLRS